MTRSHVRTAVAAVLLLGATALVAGRLRAPVRMPPAPEPTPSPAATPTSRAAGGLESRVESLLARMTLAEKVGQLQQLDGEADGRYRPEHLELARAGGLDAERARRRERERASGVVEGVVDDAGTELDGDLIMTAISSAKTSEGTFGFAETGTAKLAR